MEEKRICYGCMERVVYVNGVCPLCGYSENAENVSVDPAHIQPGVTLHERYTVGAVQSANGEGITYLGYDQSISCKVLIREYMPENLCSRVENSPVIRVIPDCLAQYKALMAEFTELYKALARFRTQGQLCAVVDLFAENNTTYVVMEYIENISLVDYLKENAGELTWEQLSALLPPLMTTIGMLHNAGIVHRAISPETIRVADWTTDHPAFILTSFSTAAARTANTELNCELYNGYAAPEQYAANTRQGTWTDIYAISAVLYRILTGSMPPTSISRSEGDNLVAPVALNPNIPVHVSNTILQGMCLNSAERIQTVTQLITNLFDENAANAMYSIPEMEPYSDESDPVNFETGYDDDYSYENEDYDSYANEYDEDETENKKENSSSAFDRLKVPLIVGIVLIVIALIIFIVVMSGNSSSDTDTVTTTTTTQTTETTTETTTEITTEEVTGDSAMPDILGKTYENVVKRYGSWIQFDVEYVYSDGYGAGKICWSQYDKDDTFDSSKAVKIQVSLGKATVTIPSYTGRNVYSYCADLYDLNIENEKVSEENYSYSDGTVMYITVTDKRGETVSLDAGAQINLNDGYKITVHYAYHPVYETVIVTEIVPVETEASTPENVEPTGDIADAEDETPVEEVPSE